MPPLLLIELPQAVLCATISVSGAIQHLSDIKHADTIAAIKGSEGGDLRGGGHRAGGDPFHLVQELQKALD